MADGQGFCAVDPCACTLEKARKNVCGLQFPETCNFPHNTLYTCGLPTTKPVLSKDCLPQECEVVNGQGQCVAPAPSACACTDEVASKCSSEWPAFCTLKADAVYSCSGLKDELPILLEECSPFGCIQEKGSAKCEADPCLCTEDGVICGSALPNCPTVNPDYLYGCTTGQAPVEADQCDVGASADHPSMHHAVLQQMRHIPVQELTRIQSKRTIARTVAPWELARVCGKDFAPSCGLNAQATYECNAVNQKPVLDTVCAADEICQVTNDVASCVPDCTCKDTNDKCGSDISPKCNLNKDTLYSCSAIGVPYAEKEICTPGTCKSGTTVCTKDPCACTKVGLVCGKDFPTECTKLNPDDVYNCLAIDGTPSFTQACPAGTCTAGVCVKPSPCICTEDGPACGGEIANCPGLDPDLYYRCTAGQAPVPFDRCSNDQPVNGDCLCNDGNTICSSYFPFECGYKQDMVQLCTGGRGSKPITKEQCAVGRCTTSFTCDKGCTCTGSVPMCGKQFDAGCGLDAARVYTCTGVGATPQPSTLCASADRCVVNVGVPKCLGPCECANVDNEG
ncbi:hypothetical protein BG004_008488 [Podila humilis]|nr:hypothetical protein BG004_008488 [Podila humilis]